jgi:hypothetical protein
MSLNLAYLAIGGFVFGMLAIELFCQLWRRR